MWYDENIWSPICDVIEFLYNISTHSILFIAFDIFAGMAWPNNSCQMPSLKYFTKMWYKIVQGWDLYDAESD